MHDHRCLKYPQTKINKLKRKPSKKLIQDIQKNYYVAGESVMKNLPDDADTILNIPITDCPGLPARRYSRSEAIEMIKTWPLVLHRHEIGPREELIDDVITKVLGHVNGYSISAESSFSDFFDFGSNKCQKYKDFANKLEQVYGKPVCPGCIKEACYIWRQMDMILRYIKDVRAICPCGTKPELYLTYIEERFHHIQRCHDCECIIIHPFLQLQDRMPCNRCMGFLREKEDGFFCDNEKCRSSLQTEKQYIKNTEQRKTRRKEKPLAESMSCWKCKGTAKLSTLLEPDAMGYACDDCGETVIPASQIDRYSEIRQKKIIRSTDKYQMPRCPCGDAFVTTIERCDICEELGHDATHTKHLCPSCEMQLYLHDHEKITRLCSCGGKYEEETINAPVPHDEYVCNKCRHRYLTWEQSIDKQNLMNGLELVRQ